MKKQLICLLLSIVLLFSCCATATAAYREMSFSDDLVEYLKKGESFRSTLYTDGYNWFIGYGCLVNPADYPNGITEEGADGLMRGYLQRFADYVNTYFLKKNDIGVTQQQFDAILAMCYALGTSWLNLSNRLPSYLKNGAEHYTDREIACAFAAWCHIGGINTVALQRRIMEAKIFLYGDYTFEQYGAPLGWNWVILDANGGENDVSDVAVFPTGETYDALPTASRSGWYFAGWEKEDGSLLLPTDTVQQNLRLKARWSASPVTPPQPRPSAFRDTAGSPSMPSSVTIAVASSAARARSLEAPAVSASSPKASCSAARPASSTQIWSSRCRFSTITRSAGTHRL